MTASRYNGDAAAHLKGLADKLRDQFRNSKAGFNDKVDGFAFDGHYYARNIDGAFVDEHGKHLDFEELLRTTDDDGWAGPPWEHPIEPPAYVNWAAVDGTPIEPQEWIVPDWVPRLETTGFGAGGAEGKTTLIQMLATAGAIRHSWMKIELPMFKSLLVLCEDRLKDVRRRQDKINRHYGCREADLTDSMRVWPRRSSEHNYLAWFDRDGIGHRTSFFDQVLAEIKAWHPDLVVIDTKSDVFHGNQNDEDQARTFIRQCTDRLTEPSDAGLVLIYHPSRAGMRDGSGMSGSVQWHAAFRSGWLLETPEPENPAPPIDDNARLLTRVKSNFSRRNETIEMKWEDGVFVRTDQPLPGGIMATAKVQKADRVFAQLFAKLSAQGRRLCDSNRSPYYAPTLFAQQPEAEGLGVKDFKLAMERALGSSIKVKTSGSPSRNQTMLVKLA